MRHKLSEARKVSHLKPLGHLLGKTGEITPPPSSPPRVLGRITLPDTAEGDPGALTANEQPLVADETEARRIAAELGTYTGMAQLAAPMTRTRDYLPRSSTPLAELTPGKAPLNSHVPWAAFLPEGFQLERGTLETGDIALSALFKGAIVERKTPADLASCVGSGRERFERELRRGKRGRVGEGRPTKRVP